MIILNAPIYSELEMKVLLETILSFHGMQIEVNPQGFLTSAGNFSLTYMHKHVREAIHWNNYGGKQYVVHPWLNWHSECHCVMSSLINL